MRCRDSEHKKWLILSTVSTPMELSKKVYNFLSNFLEMSKRELLSKLDLNKTLLTPHFSKFREVRFKTVESKLI